MSGALVYKYLLAARGQDWSDQIVVTSKEIEGKKDQRTRESTTEHVVAGVVNYGASLGEEGEGREMVELDVSQKTAL